MLWTILSIFIGAILGAGLTYSFFKSFDKLDYFDGYDRGYVDGRFDEKMQRGDFIKAESKESKDDA